MTAEIASTREAAIRALLDVAETDPAVVLVCADSMKAMRADEFKKRHPTRFFDVGIAEQNAVAVAAGLASCGLRPFVATYAGFLTMRACEQMRTFVAYPKLDVKFIGCNGGIAGGEREGVTHQFFEDLAITRALPNMKVLSPADAEETYAATRSLAASPGPGYLRVGSGREAVLFREPVAFEIGQVRVLRPGRDVALFVTGPLLRRVRLAAEALAAEGVDAAVVEVPTLKPLAPEPVAEILRRCGAAVTVEDHNIVGGLGSAIAEVAVETCPVPMARIGLRDVFPESGEPEALLDKYGMKVSDIVQAARGAASRKRPR
jgi:transketolase